MSRTAERLRLNPIRCDGFGHCAALLPDLITLDEWGYPILAGGVATAGTSASVFLLPLPRCGAIGARATLASPHTAQPIRDFFSWRS